MQVKAEKLHKLRYYLMQEVGRVDGCAVSLLRAVASYPSLANGYEEVEQSEAREQFGKQEIRTRGDVSHVESPSDSALDDKVDWVLRLAHHTFKTFVFFVLNMCWQVMSLG